MHTEFVMFKPLLIIFLGSMLCTLGLVFWFWLDSKKYQGKQTAIRKRANKPKGFKKGGFVK